jgi:hypothetical protein
MNLSDLREDFLGDKLDLLHIEPVGHQGDLLDTRLEVLLKLFDAFLRRAQDGALRG